MGAHRTDRTRWGAAGLVAVTALAGCGGDEPPARESAGPIVGTPAPSASADGRVKVREVARVKAQITRVPEGVTVAGGGPTCIQLERTGGEYGKPRYQVAVDFTTPSGAAFRGPKDLLVFFDVSVEAGGVRIDGRATFREPTDDDGLLVTEADYLTTTGRTTLQPELMSGIQEVPSGMTACQIDVQTREQEVFGPYDGRPLRDTAVVLDPELNQRDIDEA